MARTIPNDSTCNEPSSRAPSQPRRQTDCLSLPFSSHPFFQLRRATIVVAIVGVLLCFLGSRYVMPYYTPLRQSFMLLGLSAFLCALDLLCYARRKKDDPDKEPERPIGRWALVDLIMAVLFQYMFWAELTELMDRPYWYDDTNILGEWGLLAVLFCSILHAWCFWKQLMADRKQKWLASLEPKPCDRCGHLGEHNSLSTDDQQPEEQPNTFSYAGPSAIFGRANVLTPESPESAMEEGLLIGSDFGSGYRSVDRSQYEPVLESPEEIVVGKGKKKAKSLSGQKSTTKGVTS